METAAGARGCAGLAHPGLRCRHVFQRSPVSFPLARLVPRPLQTAAGPGPGPASVPSSDVNDGLAPVVFSFSEATPSPAVGTSSGIISGQGPKWSNILSTSGNGGIVGGAGLGPSSLASSTVVPLDAHTRTDTAGSSGSTTGTSVSSPGSSRPSHDVSPPDEGFSSSSPAADASHSYSDYYRQVNTPWQRFPSGSSDSPDSRPHSNDAGAPSHTPTAHTPTNGNAATHAPSPSGISEASPRPNFSPSPATTSAASDAAEVTAALARAQAALLRAETSLDDIERLSTSLDAAALESLRAAAPPSRWVRLLALARGATILGGLSFAMLASHAFGLVVQWAGAVAGAALIAGWGLRRGSLAPSGAAAAFLVGCGTLGSSLRFGATLVAFFLSSSKLTSYKEELKEGLDENAKKGGQRNWVQVLCNGLLPTVLSVAYGILAGCVDLPLGPPAAAAAIASGPALEPWRASALTGLMGGFLGYYACCCGDTWASELGPLSADTPRLITDMRPVRRGTNGGVTLLGLSASIMGGMFMGLVFYLAGLLSPTLWIFESQRAMAAGQWRLIPLGLMAGLFGSVLDSLLGATLQYSGYDRVTGRIVSRPGPDVTHISGLRLLDNNAVNAVSASATAALTAFVALKSFGF